MELSKVLTGVKTLQKSRSGSLEISGIAYDSRQVKQGWLFAAIKGEKLDGNQFVSQAVERGASAVLSEQPPRRGAAAPWIQVSSVRQTLAQAAANFYGHPARQLKLIGITGTNGKTTTTFLLESILRAAGFRV
ncbi:MAG: Mur ligase domain-containing protein, partial [Candidatus Acidiferrales bacterium]